MSSTYGSRKVGDVTTFGTIERVSLTAYFIGGEWQSFVKVDGLGSPAERLVELDWAMLSRAGVSRNRIDAMRGAK
jgi:hypothetical protein